MARYLAAPNAVAHVTMRMLQQIRQKPMCKSMDGVIGANAQNHVVKAEERALVNLLATPHQWAQNKCVVRTYRWKNVKR